MQTSGSLDSLSQSLLHSNQRSALHQEGRNSSWNRKLSLTLCLKNNSTFVQHGNTEKEPPLAYSVCLCVWTTTPALKKPQLKRWGKRSPGFTAKDHTFPLAIANWVGEGGLIQGLPSNPWYGWGKETWPGPIRSDPPEFELEKRKENELEEKP